MERNIIWKNAMNYGAVCGVAIAVFRFFTTLGDATFSPIGIVRYVILAVVIIRGTKFLRDKIGDGNIKYSRALYSGVLISLFAGIITGFYVLIEFQFIKPELLNEHIILQEEAIMKMRWLSETQVEEQIARLHKTASPLRAGFEEIFNNAFWGLVLSLPIAAFLKRENPLAGMPKPTS